MRVSTYAKKFEKAIKNRPRYETEHVEAIVTLVGDDYKPYIDLSFKESEPSLDLEEAKNLANWIKSVAK